MSEEQKQAASLAHGLTDGWKFDSDTEGWRVESPSGDSCYLFNADSEHGQASGPAIREVFRQLVGDLHFHRHEALASSPQPAQNAAALRDLAQALAWQSFGECRGYSERLLSPMEALAAARDVLGIPAAQDAPQAQPSDEEIDAIWKEGALRRDLEPSTRGVFRWSARALLSRYGAAPQAAIPEIEAMLRLCEDREWTDTNPKTALGQRLESVLMGLHNDLHEARDNAAPQAGEDARPVAWEVTNDSFSFWTAVRKESRARDIADEQQRAGWPGAEVRPLVYATPQPSAQAAPAVPLTDLHKFYGVESDAALIAAQQRHIEKLQARMPSTPSLAPQRPREG